MKKLLILPVLALFAIAASAPQTTYKVDTSASKVIWKGYKVTGEHTGTVIIKNGQLNMTDDKLVSGSFEIDMTSIKVTDLSGDMKGKLEGHLKSGDFFGVEKYPTAKFTITRAIPQDSKGNYKIIGNLTIKESTHSVKFFANVQKGSKGITASGKVTVDRSEYDVRYGSGSFFDGLGDKTIYDEFELDVNLVASK